MPAVSLINAKPKHLVNDRGKVGKRADHSQPRRISWPQQSTRTSQHQRVLNHGYRHTTRE